ncbi:hypothetical protein [Tianweitania populi]|uniref:hypothetical protein n=1 Tax=Tianweitania populi TaxID=1607949 RepID=UPI001679F416|nr:hypothetical protein [Tianweitania populi]
MVKTLEYAGGLANNKTLKASAARRVRGIYVGIPIVEISLRNIIWEHPVMSNRQDEKLAGDWADHSRTTHGQSFLALVACSA